MPIYLHNLIRNPSMQLRSSLIMDLQLLPHPLFTARLYDALFVPEHLNLALKLVRSRLYLLLVMALVVTAPSFSLWLRRRGPQHPPFGIDPFWHWYRENQRLQRLLILSQVIAVKPLQYHQCFTVSNFAVLLSLKSSFEVSKNRKTSSKLLNPGVFSLMTLSSISGATLYSIQ